MTRRDQPRRYPRTARVNEVVREVLADEIERLSDPRLGFVTLTSVDVSGDLRHATVYFSALGAGAKNQPELGVVGAGDDALAALRSAGPHLRAVLGRQVRLKYLPRLDFRVDPALVQGQRMEELIRRLHAGAGAGADGEPGTAERGGEVT